MDIRGSDGVLRTPDEHYDTPRDVEQDPYGAHLAIHLQAAEIADLRAQLAAAEAEKMAFGERVRKKAISLIDLLSLGRSHSAHKAMVQAIRALDLDALAEGEK